MLNQKGATMATFTTSKGDRLTVWEDGTLSIKTHNGNTFIGFIVNGSKVTSTSILGRRVLESAYIEYRRN